MRFSKISRVCAIFSGTKENLLHLMPLEEPS